MRTGTTELPKSTSGAKERALQDQHMPVLERSFRGRKKMLFSSRVAELLKSRQALPWCWPRHRLYMQTGRGLGNPTWSYLGWPLL